MITDFTPKVNDSAEVLACLNLVGGTFDNFINALTAEEYATMKSFIEKNKNFDRIIEFVVDEMTATKNAEAYLLNIEYLIIPMLMILVVSHGLCLGCFPRVRAGTFPKDFYLGFPVVWVVGFPFFEFAGISNSQT